MALRDLHGIRPLYIVPRDDLVSEVLVPCLQSTTSLSCMFGYFGSAALRDIAPGLAVFLGRSTERMRLLVSPNLSADDLEAMRTGVTTPAEVLERRLAELLGEAAVSESALVRHTLECLAYLLAAGRLEVKVTYLPDGLFHDKVWFFADTSGAVVVHGSSNLTVAGLTRNHEQIRVEKSWSGQDQATVIAELAEEYEALWDGRREYAVVLDLPLAIEKNLIKQYEPDTAPTHADFEAAWRHDYLRGLAPPPAAANPSPTSTPAPQFLIPPHLEWETGDFAHQGVAVREWEEHGRRAILEMATGSGKTITALVGAHRLYAEQTPLLVVIAVPILPLVGQWTDEARAFGLGPVIPGDQATRRAKLAAVESALRRLRLHAATVECLIVTHDLLCEREFQQLVAQHRGPSLLIADEVHNLGSPSFRSSPPECFSARLGLSATPVRQYDDVGTAALVDFFGAIAFSFTLQDAIGTCLVPYDYYVHPVALTHDELSTWFELTTQLNRLIRRTNEDDPTTERRIQLLRNKRRLVLEDAAGKLIALEEALVRAGPRSLRHALVYATDKRPEQLRGINRTLRQLGVRFHQLTDAETSRPRLAGEVLTAFRQGDLQVLTAKRVLDEGVDVPEVATAFIVASTTVERQWVQRRGRVLRKCDAIGKQHAELHDFLVVPPADELGSDDDVRNLLRGELDRISEFGRLARNAAAANGALAVIHPIVIEYFG